MCPYLCGIPWVTLATLSFHVLVLCASASACHAKNPMMNAIARMPLATFKFRSCVLFMFLCSVRLIREPDNVIPRLKLRMSTILEKSFRKVVVRLEKVLKVYGYPILRLHLSPILSSHLTVVLYINASVTLIECER